MIERLPAAYKVPLMGLLALSAIVELPLRLRVTATGLAILMAAVVLLVSDKLFNAMKNELLLLNVNEPLEELPETTYGTLAMVEFTVTLALEVLTVTPLLENGFMTFTLEPL